MGPWPPGHPTTSAPLRPPRAGTRPDPWRPRWWRPESASAGRRRARLPSAQPPGEEIGAVAAHEAGLLVIGQRALLGTQILGEAAAGRGVTELESPRRLFCDLARRQQALASLAGGRGPEHVLVVLRGKLEHG